MKMMETEVLELDSKAVDVGPVRISSPQKKAAPEASLKPSLATAFPRKGMNKSRPIRTISNAYTAGKKLEYITSYRGFERAVHGAASEREAAKQYSHYIVNPHGRFRRTWDVISILLIFTNALMVPYWVAFNIEASSTWRTVDWLIDTWFLVDIILNFRTAYYDDGEVVTDPKRIARHYLRGYFALDVMATLPWSPFLESMNQSLGTLAELPALLRLVRMVRMIKIIRLIKASRSFNSMTEMGAASRNVLRLLRTAFWMTIAGHVLCCMWTLVYSLEDSIDSWPHTYGIRTDNRATIYLSAMYFTFATLTTVGFGDVSAHTDAERAFALVLMMMGAVLFATMVGRMSAIAATLNRSQREAQRITDNVIEFMRHRELPKSLRQRVRDYFQYKLEHMTLFEEEEILKELSPALQRDVQRHLNRKLIHNVPFLRHADPGFINFVITKLHPVHAISNDFIIVAGEPGSHMYLLNKGEVEIVSRTGRIMKVLGSGSFFGEIAALEGCRRTTSVRAKTPCEMLSLAAPDLKRAVGLYPSFAEGLRLVAKARKSVKEADDMSQPIVPPPSHMKSWTEVHNGNRTFLERAKELAQQIAAHQETTGWESLRVKVRTSEVDIGSVARQASSKAGLVHIVGAASRGSSTNSHGDSVGAGSGAGSSAGGVSQMSVESLDAAGQCHCGSKMAMLEARTATMAAQMKHMEEVLSRIAQAVGAPHSDAASAHPMGL